MNSIFTIDIEDWFHILDLDSAPELRQWDRLPSRVEGNFRRLLDIFDEMGVRVTCFFLGWVAERFPNLVKDAAGRGHETASHGYSHALVYRMSEVEFLEDAIKSRKIIEDITGEPVHGYRAAGFSATEDTPWFFEKLIEAGYSYDSSVFPASRGHGGMDIDHYAPHLVKCDGGEIVEIPLSVTEVLGRPHCFFGGGYLRLYPYFLIRKMALKVLDEHRPVVFYVHPREVDPDQPRLSMGLKRKFKTYVNLKTTEDKIRKILRDFDVTTCASYINENVGVFREVCAEEEYVGAV